MRRAVSENMSEPTDDLAEVTATTREEACMVVVINSRVMKTPLRSRHSYGSKVASVLPSSSVRGCHPKSTLRHVLTKGYPDRKMIRQTRIIN